MNSLAPINPARVRYIKLGSSGGWERECLDKAIIRMGFGTERPTTIRMCLKGDWSGLTDSFVADGRDKGTAKRFANELKAFFEDNGTVLWITFMKERLYWAFVDGSAAEMHADGNGIWRKVKDGWQGTDVKGEHLSKDKLSGKLTKLAAYRGTSCDVDASEYVVRRINGEKMPDVERALDAVQEMRASVLPLVQSLTPQDFELLVDLIFTASGWRRIGVVGKTQDTIDIDLILPSTGEKAFVQVKSKTTTLQLADYVGKFDERSDLYKRLFYVYHTGQPAPSEDSRITIIGPERLATMVVDAGLVGWLIDKVS